jgi:hypothetical protein
MVIMLTVEKNVLCRKKTGACYSFIIRYELSKSHKLYNCVYLDHWISNFADREIEVPAPWKLNPFLNRLDILHANSSFTDLFAV